MDSDPENTAKDALEWFKTKNVFRIAQSLLWDQDVDVYQVTI